MKEHRLSRGTMVILVTNVANLLLTFLTIAILPRFLGPAVWGTYVVWASLWGLSSQIFESGGGVILNRAVPLFRKREPGRILPLLRALVALKAVLIPAVLVVGWLTVGGTNRETLSSFASLSLIVLSAFLFSWTSLEAGLHYGLQKMLPQGCFAPLNMALRILAVVALTAFWQQNGVPAGFFVSALALWLLYQLWGQNVYRSLRQPDQPLFSFPFKEYMSFGIVVTIGLLGTGAVLRFPALAANMMEVSREQIGLLGLAVFCLATIRTIPSQVVFSLLPHMIELAHEDKRQEFERHSLEAWRYTNLLMYWMIASLLALAPGWFPLFLGKEYGDSIGEIVNLLVWSVPAMAFGVWLAYFQQILYAQGIRKAFVWAAILVLVSYPVCVSLLPADLGLKRFVISLAISTGLGTALTGYFSHFRLVMASSAIVPLCIGAALVWPLRYLPQTPLVEFLWTAFVLTPLYFLLLRLAGLVRPVDVRRLLGVFRIPPGGSANED